MGLRKRAQILILLYLSTKMFPRLSEGEKKGGIFTGPDISKMMKDNTFEKKMTSKERAAWKAFKNVVTGFLGNRKNENFEKLIDQLMQAYHIMGCRMSLKMHMLFCHLDLFSENMGEISEEAGERFHQDIEEFENRYQGQEVNPNMMGDYIWSLKRDDDASKYKRRSRSSLHF